MVYNGSELGLQAVEKSFAFTATGSLTTEWQVGSRNLVRWFVVNMSEVPCPRNLQPSERDA
jgi:hypothetical protein